MAFVRVISFTDTILRNIDEGCLKGAVFINLRKAFDIVDHKFLQETIKGPLYSLLVSLREAARIWPGKC